MLEKKVIHVQWQNKI